MGPDLSVAEVFGADVEAIPSSVIVPRLDKPVEVSKITGQALAIVEPALGELNAMATELAGIGIVLDADGIMRLAILRTQQSYETKINQRLDEAQQFRKLLEILKGAYNL